MLYLVGVYIIVSKILGKIYVSVTHTKTKIRFDKIVSENEWFWVPLTTKTTEYYTDNWSSKFTIHFSSSITVEFLSLIKLQFTIDAQNFLRFNQFTHGHVSSWTVASFQGSRGAVWNGLSCIKMCWWSVPSFSIGSEYPRGFKCPHI